MKRLGMLLVLLSVSMFALGCQPKEADTPADPPAVEEPTEGEAPAEPTLEEPAAEENEGK